MKIFVELLCEHYTAEGIEVSKFDEAGAQELVFWNPELIDPSDIVRLFESPVKPGNSVLGFTNGDTVITKGLPHVVLRNIQNQHEAQREDL